MIRIAAGTDLKTGILFFTKAAADKLYDGEGGVFRGEYLQTLPRLSSEGKQECCVGLGEEPLSKREVMEAAASGTAFMREHKISRFYVDVNGLGGFLTEENFPYFIQGLCLGGYEPPRFLGEKKGKADRLSSNLEERYEADITLTGEIEQLTGMTKEQLKTVFGRGVHMAQGILFARDMVNYPGNLLRPADFAEAIRRQMEGLNVEVGILDRKQLEELEMGGLLTVGGGSAFAPCMAVLRYRGAKAAKEEGEAEARDAQGKKDSSNEAGEPETIGLIGKGVTCDTGGYCLKSSGSMAGIRGDMAGGAAVAGCIYALAADQAKVNVTGVIPICENRISPDSYLPGDVITMYNKTRVEICNTDAEGRLILGDAAAYAVECEGVDKVVDIATLTGAVVSLFGFSIGGVLSDNEELYARFEAAADISKEQYARIPYYEEHEEMLKSQAADLKNLGPDYCGTITVGLFIRRFVEGKPWLHMDIAGTAWVDQPIWKFQSKGATGAGVTTLYELCRGGENEGLYA